MTADGHVETAAEIQAAVQSEEFQALYRELLLGAANPPEYPTLYEATLKRIRRRYGPLLAEAVLEWLAA